MSPDELRIVARGAREQLDELKRAFAWFLRYQDAEGVGEHFDKTLDVVVTYHALKDQYPPIDENGEH
jgi:hypothetical protein